MPNDKKLDFISAILFLVSLVFISFFYGIAATRYNLFPYPKLYPHFRDAISYIEKIVGKLEDEKIKYNPTTYTNKIPINIKESIQPGLNLVTSLQKDNILSAFIMDSSGNIIHKWDVNWFHLWPNPDHLPEKDQPVSLPGTHIHGIAALPNGDIIFNYEHLGLIRVGLCGNVVWRLPYRTHHSIQMDSDGNFWVSAQRNHDEPLHSHPYYVPEIIEPIMLKISPTGSILKEISVLDLLKNNNLSGLLHLPSQENRNTFVFGDTLHLNDIEAFPDSLRSGFFEKGDLLISLRNANTIIVFNEPSGKIKKSWTGLFSRQHDPDFLSGDSISVFDNNNVSPDPATSYSRILLLTDSTFDIFYSGSETDIEPFYTDIMGKHQWLDNGNLLVTVPIQGRAIELNKDKKIVWEYVNIVDKGVVGLMEEVQRLPEHFNSIYSAENIKKSCGNVH